MSLLTARLRRALDQIPYLSRAVALVWASARGWTIAWGALLIVQGVLPVATVTLTRLLVDSLVAVVDSGGGWESLRHTLLLAVLMAGVMLVNQLLGTAAGWVRATQAELVQDHVTLLIHEKSVAVDMAFYDSADYYDHLHRARLEGSHRPAALLESIGSLVQNGITLVAMAGFLIPYAVWLPFALLLGALPALYVALRHSLRRYRWRVRATADERRAWYYYWLLTAREVAAEVRLFGLGELFRDRYQSVRERLRTERLKMTRDQGLAELAAGVLGLIAFGAAMIWMLSRALNGYASLGDLALFYQVVNQGQGAMRSLLTSIQQVYSNSLFLAHLFEFLELEPTIASPERPRPAPRLLEHGIWFRNVTFCYPGGDRAALRDFSLFIEAGQVAAVVGPNGAGKTTLLKLLCRLYDPQEGRIELVGVDLRDLDVDELRRMVTVLFQEPVQYNATVAENIGLGDISHKPTAREIEAAAAAAGADEVVARLSDGYDTLLGRRFTGGTDLSVGEWQRVALARAFLRQAPIIVLDEPTSAMDSWAETDWLRRFRELAKGRTAVIVTHRFTTAMHADSIHVVREGRIAESGTHEELVSSGGHYAESWRAQVRETGRVETGRESGPASP